MIKKEDLLSVEIGVIYSHLKVLKNLEPMRPEDNFKGIWLCENIKNGKRKKYNGQYLLTIRNKECNKESSEENDNTEDLNSSKNKVKANDGQEYGKNVVFDENNNPIGMLCKKCHTIKPINKFRNNFDGVCLDCNPYKENSYGDPVNIRREESTEDSYRMRQLFSSMLTQDNKNGRQNNMTLEYIKWITSKPCIYCGGFNYSGREGDSENELTHTGIDRIDSNIGHIIGNVVPCCNRCNMMKGKKNLKVWYRAMNKTIKNAENARNNIVNDVEFKLNDEIKSEMSEAIDNM